MNEELELAASGVASDIMEMIQARAFDESATPISILEQGNLPSGVGDFTPAWALGMSGDHTCDLLKPAITPHCDDVDDLHRMRGVPVEATLSNGAELPFEADVNVYYVDSPADTRPSSSATRHKRVDLTLRSSLGKKDHKNVFTTSRVISYDPIKTERDYESCFGPIGVALPSSVTCAGLPDNEHVEVHGGGTVVINPDGGVIEIPGAP